MYRPNVPIEKFVKDYGFKKCKGSYGKSGCYYLCLSHGCHMLFLSPVMFCIIDWKDDDPRIHKNANCRYGDKRTASDIVFEMIKGDYIYNDPNCMNAF